MTKSHADIETTVYYRNCQWMVTNHGIEAVASDFGLYEIEASRLTETTDRENGTFYEWPVHMEEKGKGLDLNAFIGAFIGGLAIHKGKYEPELDRQLLEKSILEALRRRAANERDPDYE